MSESKTFETRTASGLRQAERYKARLENKYERVIVRVFGLDRVLIYGENHK